MKQKINLKELNLEELKLIEGGDWIYDLGAATKRAICKIGVAIVKSTYNKDLTLGHVGGGRP
ncbi:hypothetical protein AB4865_01860 [Capnocytophaga sp. ARDL2]|uniref:hypothetical protein n=1 Tax=Capnocytophaga sp. ARDL2 TaxID=3238809 RepID=UPI00355805A5